MTNEYGKAPALFRVDRQFRWRGTEVSRLEAFSDAIFALVLALLFLSDVRIDSLAGLSAALKSLIPFAVTFALMVVVWLEHYLFFRRYDLRDGYTMFLNFVLLFLVLFYSFPLKFMFTFLAVRMFGPIGEQTHETMVQGMTDTGALDPMVFYGAGLGAVFTIYALMYLHAWRRREDLALDPAEQAITRFGLYGCLIYVGFAVASIAVATLIGDSALSGLLYFGIGPAMGVHGYLQGARVVQLTAAR